MKNRPGFSLPDILVSLVVMGVIGASLAQVMTVQSRFYQKHEGRAQARAVSRSGTNLILSDLRMIETGGGIVNATSTRIEVLVPYAFGVMCEDGTGSGNKTAAMMPVDATVREDLEGTGNNAEITGWAWRQATGDYQYMAGKVVDKSGGISASPCNTNNISTNTAVGGWLVRVADAPTGATIGTPIFLYTTLVYEFTASQDVPGAVGLWRTRPARNGAAAQPEELAAPFDASASFRFYVGTSSIPVSTPPTPLSNLRGFELRLTAVNERGVNVASERAPFTTAVFFKNKL